MPPSRTTGRGAGDERTAADAREFLLRWFDRFPQYRSNPFWLSGESYAGHCEPPPALLQCCFGMTRQWHPCPLILPMPRSFADVPNLAAEIVRGNDERAERERVRAAGKEQAEAEAEAKEKPEEEEAINLQGFLVGEWVGLSVCS